MSKICAALGAVILAVPSMAWAGPYLGLGIGGARNESTLSSLNVFPSLQVPGPTPGTLVPEYTGGENFSGNTVTFDVAAGWMFAQYFGIEVGYADFGKATENYRLPDSILAGPQTREWTAQMRLSALRAFLIGSYPLGKSVDVYAKLGAISWDASYDGFERNAAFSPSPPIGPRNPPVSFKDDGTDLAAGAGLNLKMDGPVSLRLDFTYYDVETTDSVWSAGLLAVYNF